MNNLFIRKKLLWLLLSVLSAGSMAWYVTAVWSANQPPQFSDLYAPWWAAHELLLHGRNPYSPAVAHEIQTVIYGAPASDVSTNDPSNIAGGFAYPPSAALLLWPTVYLSFEQVQKLFLGTSVLAILLSLALWLRFLRLRPSPLLWMTLAFFTLGSFPALQAIRLQNLSVIAAALIALSLFLVSADHLLLAGIFLALSTFKPQFAAGLILGLALWITGDWRRRRPLAWSFLITMLLLFLMSSWLVPGWIHTFFSVLRAYRLYTYGHSLLDVWFTPRGGAFIGVCLLLAALAVCWKHRSKAANSARFSLITTLLLAVTLIVIPTLAPHAQLLLLPGFLNMIHMRKFLSSSGTPAKMIVAAAWALLAWSWIAAFGLLVAALLVPIPRLLRFWQLPLYTSPLLPLAVSFALSCLLWSIPQQEGRKLDLSGNIP
jgi:hypothetical protein